MLRPIVRKPSKAREIYPKGTRGGTGFKSICHGCHTVQICTAVKSNDGVPQYWDNYCNDCIKNV